MITLRILLSPKPLKIDYIRVSTIDSYVLVMFGEVVVYSEFLTCWWHRSRRGGNVEHGRNVCCSRKAFRALPLQCRTLARSTTSKSETKFTPHFRTETLMWSASTAATALLKVQINLVVHKKRSTFIILQNTILQKP